MKGTPTCLLCIYFLVGRKLVNMEEIWKDIKGFEGRYMISNLGRVKSMKYRHHNKVEILKEDFKFGYKRVCLFTKDGKRKRIRVHRLVAQAFIPNPNNYSIINHKDENKENNRADNLEWCTQKYNINYGTRTERASTKIRKAIIQIDEENKIINQYNSIKEVEENLKYNRSNIIACAKGRIKTAYGYIWKYAD